MYTTHKEKSLQTFPCYSIVLVQHLVTRLRAFNEQCYYCVTIRLHRDYHWSARRLPTHYKHLDHADFYLFNRMLTLKVLVVTIDALGHFETG